VAGDIIPWTSLLAIVEGPELPDITIVQATIADIGTASSILLEAARWQASLGAPMWPEDILTPDNLLHHAEAGELHLAILDGEPVGVFLLQWDDQRFWSDVPKGESAFVHRLAVRRSAAGQGVAAAMIAWCTERAQRAGMRCLRLDCDARRPRLTAFYENLGFLRQEDLVWPNWVSARYQMPLI
jgi:GNAT superfamily N-acetyltransferase